MYLSRDIHSQSIYGVANMKTVLVLAGLVSLCTSAENLKKRAAYAAVYSPVYTLQYPNYFSPVPPPTAVAEIRSMGDVEGSDGIEGHVMFTQTINGIVLISGNVSGLSEGHHGFHIHDLGDTREGCKSMGPHFNPGHTHHGGPADPYRHIGDLGNILAGSNGVAHIQESDHLITLTGPDSIVGRGLVVHASKDDFGRGGDKESLVTGNAGGRIACGVIAWAAPTPPVPPPAPASKPEAES